MRSEDVRLGMMVKVLDAAKRGGRGRIGTIGQTYDHTDYLAMEVRFGDGSVELYWHHELGQTTESAGNTLEGIERGNYRRASAAKGG